MNEEATSLAVPAVHPGGSDLIQVAVVGCGGRGGGAVLNALATSNQGPVRLVAMADPFADRVHNTYAALIEAVPESMDVPEERRFVGYDAYRHAMDCLRPGDVVILTTPPAFRWVHFRYAVEKKLNVFMEKPTTVDGPTSRRMLELGEQSVAANLKVCAGLMSRHALGLLELHDRIQNGEIGEIQYMRGYRMQGPGGFFESPPKPSGITDLEYQLRRFHSFLWASGGCFSDFYIHHIDHLCWMKNALPVTAQALGGRHNKLCQDGSIAVDQNFDTYTVEYVFADGTRLYFEGRSVQGALSIYSSYVHGSKGMAVAARQYDCNGPSAIYEGQNPVRDKELWRSDDTTSPYQNEWDTLMAAIRQDKPFNEVRIGVEASLVTSMGRMAAHTGQLISYDDMLNCDHEFAPGLDTITADSPAPVLAGPDGRYPAPNPGANLNREY